MLHRAWVRTWRCDATRKSGGFREWQAWIREVHAAADAEKVKEEMTRWMTSPSVP